MSSHRRQDVYTLRHLLFHMGVMAFAGALIGAAAGAMDWGTGLVYAVGLPIGAGITLFALRDGLFETPRRLGRSRHRHQT